MKPIQGSFHDGLVVKKYLKKLQKNIKRQVQYDQAYDEYEKLKQK